MTYQHWKRWWKGGVSHVVAGSFLRGLNQKVESGTLASTQSLACVAHFASASEKHTDKKGA